MLLLLSLLLLLLFYPHYDRGQHRRSVYATAINTETCTSASIESKFSCKWSIWVVIFIFTVKKNAIGDDTDRTDNFRPESIQDQEDSSEDSASSDHEEPSTPVRTPRRQTTTTRAQLVTPSRSRRMATPRRSGRGAHTPTSRSIR